MTKAEFAEVIGWLTAAIGKPIVDGGKEAEDMRKARMNVYYELLGDLQPETLQIAAKRVALEHPWNTFPSAAELRAAAASVVASRVTSGDAWKMALEIASAYDPSRAGQPYMARGDRGMELFDCQLSYLCRKMPPIAIKAITSFGPNLLATGNLNFMQRDFVKFFEEFAAEEATRALLPPALMKQIESGTAKRLPVVSKLAAMIGTGGAS